jgi:hypothetical protein
VSERLRGKRIIVLCRVSGAGQLGNYSSDEQAQACVRFIEDEGGACLLLDENLPAPDAPRRAMSGRDLAKREVALEALDTIDRGEADGLAWYDVKRLSRDEFVIDPGVILKRLARRRALLVTHNAIIRPWDKDDRFYYQLQAMMAGKDVIDIRDTFWRGIFNKAEREPFFMGAPPVGYTTIPVKVQLGTKTKLKNQPAKHPAHAALMADLVRWLDACASAAEVAGRVNAHHSHLIGQAGQRQRRRRNPEGRPVWTAQNITYLLRNAKYWGEFRFGDRVARDNSVWDDDDRRGREQRGAFVQHRPDLAYWTQAQAAAWREKFHRAPGGAPWSRVRKYPHGLAGVLACPACGAPLVGFGSDRYRCHNGVSRVCATPGLVTEPVARRMLRGLLPGVLRGLRGLDDEVRRRAGDETARGEALRRRLDARRAQMEALTEAWYPAEGPPRRVPDAVARRLEQWQADADRLDAQRRTLADRAAEGAAVRERWVGLLATDLDAQLATFDALPAEAQAAIYRVLLTGVRIAGEGSGPARVHRVLPGWREPLRERVVSEDTAWSATSYPPTLLPLLHAS